MPLSLYDVTVPIIIRYLNNLSACLKKGETYLNEHSTPHSNLLMSRLAPDMKPFTYQIQSVSNTAKSLSVLLAGNDRVPMDDNETTFEELYARIAKTIEVLKGVDPKSMEGQAKEDDEVVMPVGKGEHRFKSGREYALAYAMPNFYFHVGMAYALLRAEGVPVGKMDYLSIER